MYQEQCAQYFAWCILHVCSSSLVRTPKLQLIAEQSLTGECWVLPRKDTPCPRAKEKPEQGGRRGKIVFRIKSHTCQRCSEGSNKPCVHQDPETPQRLSQNCVWVSPVEVLLKPGLENFEHYFTSVWDECNCAVIWAFFGIAFLWDWDENWSFPVLWPLLSFPNLLAYWVQHFHSIIFQDLE